jgi:hypothetical protein
MAGMLLVSELNGIDRAFKAFDLSNEPCAILAPL